MSAWSRPVMARPERGSKMNVSIKEFAVKMDIKSRGIELEVRNTDDEHLGDLIVTKARLVWCPGRTLRRNGKKIRWEDFIAMMESR